MFTLKDAATGFWIRTAQREEIREELSQELALGNVLPFSSPCRYCCWLQALPFESGFAPY